MEGTELLDLLQREAPEVPVILCTGEASVATAVRAIALRAFRYLLKPVDPGEMLETLDKAVRERGLAKERQEAFRSLRAVESEALRLSQLSKSFRSALETLWVAFQPIVDRNGGIFGYEALMRTREPSLPHPGAVLDAAERLKRLPDLGRLMRARTAAQFAEADPSHRLFVNLLPSDLFDESLHADDSPLMSFAGRVVLEVTERSSIHDLKDIGPRTESLRSRGYKIAVDDLGAGYAGLTSFALLRPDVAKIDMSLVRNVDSDPVKQRLIASMVKLCEDLSIQVVAEGIETAAERDAVASLGVHLFQGYFIGKPAAGFSKPTW
jgi:EAL domain-containing protein (putative c-di-GMP-specific phosphodiesterase class I)